MANRYTGSTLTQREVETIERCIAKLNKIYRRRYLRGNEQVQPIYWLGQSIRVMEKTVQEVKQARRNLE